MATTATTFSAGNNNITTNSEIGETACALFGGDERKCVSGIYAKNIIILYDILSLKVNQSTTQCSLKKAPQLLRQALL